MEDLQYDPKYETLAKALSFATFIVLNGLPTVGKTTLLRYVLNSDSDFIYSYIDGNDNHIINSIQFYNRILDDLEGKLHEHKKQKTNPKKISSARDFVDAFEKLCEMRQSSQRLIVALDRIEFFKKTPLMDCLNVLATTANLVLVIVTNGSACTVVEDYFKSDSLSISLQRRMINIQLSPWSKADIVKQICKDLPRQYPDLYKKFVNNVVQIAYNTNTRDYKDLKLYCQENYIKFVRFYREKRFNQIRERSPTARDMNDEEIEENYCNRTSDNEIISSFFSSFKSITQERDMSSLANLNIDAKVELEKGIMIVAVYVTANTKPSDDKKNFVKLQKKRHKKENQNGPNIARQFSLERLIHIYKELTLQVRGIESTIKNPYKLTDDALGNVKMLEDLKIIQKIGSDIASSHTKFILSKNIGKGYIKKIAKNCGIQLEHYHGMNFVEGER